MRRRLAEPPDSRRRVSSRLMPGGRSSRRNGAACRALRLFGQGACFVAWPPVHYGLRRNNWKEVILCLAINRGPPLPWPGSPPSRRSVP